MDQSEKQLLEQQAKELATLGFEQGFKEAIYIIEGIAKDGKHQETRDMAEIFVKLLQKSLPEVVAAAPGMFSFQFIEDATGNTKITLH